MTTTNYYKTTFLYSLFAIVGCVLLNIGSFRDYGFTDAYEFLWSAHNQTNFKGVFIRGGRPFYGVLHKLTFGGFAQTIADLKWVRFISICGSALLSIQLFSILLRLKFEKRSAGILSFLIFTLPTFGIYANWSVTFGMPIALNLSFLAGVFLVKVFRDQGNRYLNFSFALLLVISSLLIYQPTGSAFFIPVVIFFTLFPEQLFKKIILVSVFYGVSFGLYFALYKLSLNWYGLVPLSRAGMDWAGLPVEIFEFYGIELKRLFYGSLLLVKNDLFKYLGLFLFLGFFVLLILQKSKRTSILLLIPFLLLVLPITYLPNLLSVDDWICSRTIAPAAILVLFFQFYFLLELSRKYKVIRWFSLALVVLVISMAAVNTNVYISGIQSKEYKVVKEHFEQLKWEETDRILLIRPELEFLKTEGFYKRSYSDEYSRLSTSIGWAPIPFFKQVIYEELNFDTNLKFPKIETYSSIDEYDTTGAVVVDLQQMLFDEFSE